MKQQFGLGVILAMTSGFGIAGCSCEEQKGGTTTDESGADASVSSQPTGTDTLSNGPNPSGTTGTSSSVNTTAGTEGGSGSAGSDTSLGGATDSNSLTGSDTASSGPTCSIASPTVFSRSDTDAVWDDNDFSTVVLESGACPVLVNVTWPHEAGWQDADPSEANQEQTHFTLDANPPTTDLSNKQINLTIELTDDLRGDEATTGGYVVSLVSVSTYQYETVVVPEPTSSSAVADAGDVDASLDAAVDVAFMDAAADAGVLDADVGVEPPMTVTQTGYSEAESAPEDRLILRRVGDRATISFPLPSKTAEIDSYDPTTPIKINIRIYNMFTPEAPPDALSDAGAGDAGDAGDEGALETSTSSASSASATSSSAASSSAVSSSGASSAVETLSSTSTESVTTAPADPNARVYGYLTSQFAISSFTVTDVEP